MPKNQIYYLLLVSRYPNFYFMVEFQKLANEANSGIMRVSYNGNDFLGMKEAAKYIYVSLSSMQKYSAKRLIPKYRPHNGKVLFRKADLDYYLNVSRMSSCRELESEIETITSKKFIA